MKEKGQLILELLVPILLLNLILVLALSFFLESRAGIEAAKRWQKEMNEGHQRQEGSGNCQGLKETHFYPKLHFAYQFEQSLIPKGLSELGRCDRDTP